MRSGWRIALLCALAGALSGCGGFSPQPLPLPPRAVRRASFEFTPPGEFGWMSAPASQWGFAVLGARDRESVLAAVLFICVNPHLPRQSIMLTLVQRCEVGHEDPQLIQKAEALAAFLQP